MSAHPDTIAHAKAELRHSAKAKRAALSTDTRADASMALANYGLDFLGPLVPGTIIGGFMPIGDEISPLPLMSKLHAAGCVLALPVMCGKTEPLEFRSYTLGDALARAVWGIREPRPDKAVLLPAIVLTALLAFDDAGYRLGYGGGYYDRTLSALRGKKPITTVGIAYDQQWVDAVPHLDYDERLDWILTPSGARQTKR
jgi:5-formyltetrahydrofolate cyclo-ligase